MNGMLLKEALQLKRQGIANTIMSVIAGLIIISIFGIRTNILTWLFIWTFNGRIAGGILRFDVPSHWNRWCVAAPIPRGDVVKSKYALICFYELVAFLITAVGITIFIALNNVTPIHEIRYAFSMAAVLMLFDTITLVCIFWRGGYHGGNTAYIINLLFMAGITFLLPLSGNFAWYFIVFAVIIRAASLPLSVWLYERRSL